MTLMRSAQLCSVAPIVHPKPLASVNSSANWALPTGNSEPTVQGETSADKAMGQHLIGAAISVWPVQHTVVWPSAALTRKLEVFSGHSHG